MERRLRAHSPDGGGGGGGRRGGAKKGGSDCLKPTQLAYLSQAYQSLRGGPLYEVRLLSVYCIAGNVCSNYFCDLQ